MSGNGNPYADTRDMYTVHTVFRREYALLPDLVRAVAAKDTERAEVVAGHVRLTNLILHHHHSAEDAVIWPLLLKRAPREVDPVVRLLESQHDRLDVTLDDVGARLDRWRQAADPADGEALAAVLQRLAVSLYEHMGLEEQLVLPLVERHVFATEWEAMVQEGAAEVGDEAGLLVVGMLMYEGGLEPVPAQMRETLGELAPKAYAAYCERVHGNPMPPRSGEVGIGTPPVGVIARPARRAETRLNGRSAN